MKIRYDASLTELMQCCPQRIESLFSSYVQNVPCQAIRAAMQYAFLNGGKRIRPLLIYATAATLGAIWEDVDVPACSVEMVHTYSLIHDDLPGMDDADMRRGKPACHRAFGDGMAILAGDALHTLAVQVLTKCPATFSAERRLAMLDVLVNACGPFGMAAGQALDLTLMDDETLTVPLIENIYHLKTGALFSACIELGRLASNDEDEIHQAPLGQFGRFLGLAYQIQDDLVDINASSAVSGKPQGIDRKNNKVTYPQLIGIEKAQLKMQALYEQAIETINYLGDQAQLLRDLVKYLLQSAHYGKHAYEANA